MSAVPRQRSVVWSPADHIEESRDGLRGAVNTPMSRALRYTSAWLWALAFAISITLWFGSALLVWTFL